MSRVTELICIVKPYVIVLYDTMIYYTMYSQLHYTVLYDLYHTMSYDVMLFNIVHHSHAM